MHLIVKINFQKENFSIRLLTIYPYKMKNLISNTKTRQTKGILRRKWKGRIIERN